MSVLPFFWVGSLFFIDVSCFREARLTGSLPPPPFPSNPQIVREKECAAESERTRIVRVSVGERKTKRCESTFSAKPKTSRACGGFASVFCFSFQTNSRCCVRVALVVQVPCA
eukprot:RCo011730